MDYLPIPSPSEERELNLRVSCMPEGQPKDDCQALLRMVQFAREGRGFTNRITDLEAELEDFRDQVLTLEAQVAAFEG